VTCAAASCMSLWPRASRSRKSRLRCGARANPRPSPAGEGSLELRRHSDGSRKSSSTARARSTAGDTSGERLSSSVSIASRRDAEAIAASGNTG
jgi:hypothetical protein